MYLNKAMVVGNLTRDPELKSLPSGIQVASFSVATNRVWKDKSGAKQESADYHNVVVFGKIAENAALYLKKGSQVLIEGRLQTRSWDGPDGKKVYRTEIVADLVQYGARKEGTTITPPPKKEKGESIDKAAAQFNNTPHEGLEPIEYPTEEVNPEDIPY